MEVERVIHQFQPVFDENSKILMLGSIPSPKSRENGFYYGHPRNRFWKVIADVCGEKVPETIEEKRELLLRNGIAVWDVLESCEIRGADDGSIRNPTPNDMRTVLEAAEIRAIFTTGTKAYTLYQKYCYPVTGMMAIRLPSTSPANCGMSYEELRLAYGKILRYLH